MLNCIGADGLESDDVIQLLRTIYSFYIDKLIPCQIHGTNFYYAVAQYNVSGLVVKTRTMSKDKRSSRIFKTIGNLDSYRTVLPV